MNASSRALSGRDGMADFLENREMGRRRGSLAAGIVAACTAKLRYMR
jgi:hypothetical protein